MLGKVLAATAVLLLLTRRGIIADFVVHFRTFWCSCSFLYILYMLQTLYLRPNTTGVAECYSEVDCGGIEIASSGSETLDQRDCCVNQNGLSYNDGGTCRPCIGMFLGLDPVES